MPSDAAEYPHQEELGPCPLGTAFRSVHPVTGRPVVVRRIRPDALAPFDTPAAYVARAEAAARVSHPHLAPVLDAGMHAGEPFVVVDPLDGADLQALIEDIGPMPVLLAAEFTRQAARGLEAAHAAGLAHGDVRPAHLFAGPLVPMGKPREDGSTRYRPGATATVRVCELGLIPARAKAADWPADWDASYLPPERRESSEHTPAGDVFMLGGVLAFLLTGRPPGVIPLTITRPDAPPELVRLAGRMRAATAADRPTMGEVAEQLDRLVKGIPPAPTPPNPATDSAEVPLVEPAAPPVGWAAHPAVGGGVGEVFTPAAWSPADPHPSDESTTAAVATVRRPRPAVSRNMLLVGAALFVLFNLLAVIIWVLVLSK